MASFAEVIERETGASGLGKLLRNQKLLFADTIVDLGSLDRLTIRLVRAASRGTRELAIIFPSLSYNVQLGLAVATLINRMLRYRTDSGFNAEGWAADPTCVALLSLSPDLRQKYLRLAIQEKAGHLELSKIFAAARVREKGEVVPLTTKDGKPRLLFVNSFQALTTGARGPQPTDIILDHVNLSQETVVTALGAHWGNPEPLTIHLLRHGFDPNITLLQERHVAIWWWDREACRALSPEEAPQGKVFSFSTSAQEMSVIRRGCDDRVVRVQDDQLKELCRAVARGVGTLFGEARRSASEELQALANRIRYYLWRLQGLPFPIDVHESVAARTWGMRSFRRALERLARDAATCPAKVQPVAEGCVQDLYQVVELLRSRNGKFEILVDHVLALLRAGKWVGLVLRGRSYRTAFDTATLLHAQELFEHDQRLARLTIRDLRNPPRLDHLVFHEVPGPYPECLLSGAAAARDWVLYRWEVDPWRSFVGSRLSTLAREARKARLHYAEDCLPTLAAHICEQPTLDPVQVTPTTLRDVTISREPSHLEPLTPVVTDHKPLGDFLVAEQEMEAPGDIEWEAAEPGSDAEPSANAPAFLLEFDTGTRMYWPAAKPVKRLRSASTEPLECAASELEGGDVIIVVNVEGRRSLFDAIVAKVHDFPELAPDIAFMEAWHTRLAAGFETLREQYPSLEEIHARAQANGLSVEASTLVTWIRGDVIGPENPEDIAAMGRTMADPVLVRGWRPIAAGINRIRAIHRQLGRALSERIASAGATAVFSGRDIVVDGRLGLYLDDFRDVLAVRTLTAVEGPIDVAVHLLGKEH